MKKFILLTAIASLAASTAVAQDATNRAAQPAAAAAANLPVKIGLVDMARVFKEYDKFEDMREDLKAEMTAAMEDAQGLAQQAKAIQEELGLLKQGSPEYIKREADLARLSSDFETKRKVANATYVRKEAEIFESVYTDASNVIKLYGDHFKFTLIMRFNSEPLDPENPQKLANGLNKLVVYHRTQDDITGPVIEYLNKQYAPSRKPRPQTADGAAGTIGETPARN